jgi:hypothetical protein
VSLWVDCVAKLFLGVGTKFSRGAGALISKSCGGSHDQSDFQPAAFVSSLQGIGLPKTHFDGRAAKFCRHLIFEFCNTIGQKRPIRDIAAAFALHLIASVGWATARSAVPTKPLREARMAHYRRLKIEGGAFFYTLALADCGSDLLVQRGRIVGMLRRMNAWARRYVPLPTLRLLRNPSKIRASGQLTFVTTFLLRCAAAHRLMEMDATVFPEPFRDLDPVACRDAPSIPADCPLRHARCFRFRRRNTAGRQFRFESCAISDVGKSNRTTIWNKRVGWVERSETHQFLARKNDGFRKGSTHPTG